MPHAVVECSKEILDAREPEGFMHVFHEAMMATGIFSEDDCKVRLHPVTDGMVAGKPALFLHCTIYLLSGRDDATKKQVAQTVLSAVQEAGIHAASISVDVRDLNRDVYSKQVG